MSELSCNFATTLVGILSCIENSLWRRGNCHSALRTACEAEKSSCGAWRAACGAEETTHGTLTTDCGAWRTCYIVLRTRLLTI